MDNDLMARRLRPPSQPNSGNGAGQPQTPSPWDVPLTDDTQFAPPDPRVPDPSARADVPWDRPAAEPWPPAETDMPPTWSAQGSGFPDAPQSPAPPAAPAASARPEWPAADPLTQDEAPWDKPAASEASGWRDPDDAFAPVVGDVQGSAAAWAAWDGTSNVNGNGNNHASGSDDSQSSSNGYDVTHAIGGAAIGGGGGIRYIPQNDPEPLTVAAHSDQAPAGDDPHGMGSNPLPEWPAEDDLTVMPSSGRGPVIPEDSWPTTPVTPAPAATSPSDATPPPADTPATPQQSAPAWPPFDPTPTDAAAEPDPEPVVPTPAPTPAPPAAPAPVTPTIEIATPADTQVVAMTPSGTPQNMVLRIELAIVDASHRADPADSAKRVGPDADVRRPEYAPRNAGDPDQMPEPEYVWGAPPPDAQDPPNQQPQDRRQTADRRQTPDRRRQGQPNQPQQQWPSQQQTQQPQQVSPPPSAWLPAAEQPVQPQQPQQPQYPQSPAWDEPPAAPQYQQPQQQALADPPAPWASPAQPSNAQQSPYPPAPTWAMTQPTPPYQPEQPQYMPPSAPQRQQPQAPRFPQAAPPQYPQSAQQQPYKQPAWPPAAQPPAQPAWPPAARPQHMPQPGQSVQSAQSAPAADLWFVNNQGTVATAADAEAQPEGKSNSLLTAGLTVGFAVLVIVLVLVFIQLMTSLLR